MSGRRRNIIIAIVVGGLLLAGGSPVQAHGFSHGMRGISVTVVTGGFALTPLDVWGFATVPMVPTVSIVRPMPPIAVCPCFGFFPFFPVFPVFVAVPVFFVDPPPTPARRWSASSESAPEVVVTGVVPPVTVRDLAQDPGQYDRQVVSLVADISALHSSVDVRGSPYTEIRLENMGASVAALAWGTPKVSAGQRVRITGNFYTRAPFALAPGSPVGSVLEATVIDALP